MRTVEHFAQAFGSESISNLKLPREREHMVSNLSRKNFNSACDGPKQRLTSGPVEAFESVKNNQVTSDLFSHSSDTTSG